MDAEPLRYGRIDSPIGPLWLAETAKGLASLDWDVDEVKARALWKKRTGRDAVRDEAAIRPHARALERYFAGRARDFGVDLDLLEGTDFQRRCWAALQTIPYGETRSYKWLAQAVGQPKGFRAVGMANHRNPVPVIIPCHRVVNEGGGLGGYGGGLDVKRALLRLEGALPDARLPL